MSEYRLTQEIMDRSFAKTWAEAKLEWEIAEVTGQGRRTPASVGTSRSRFDRMLASLESHRRTIKGLRNLLQEKRRRLTLPRKTPPTPRGR